MMKKTVGKKRGKKSFYSDAQQKQIVLNYWKELETKGKKARSRVQYVKAECSKIGLGAFNIWLKKHSPAGKIRTRGTTSSIKTTTSTGVRSLLKGIKKENAALLAAVKGFSRKVKALESKLY